MNIYSIYRVTNNFNGKVYIGFDSNWPNRMMEHIRQTKYLGRAFNQAIKKYGLDSFDWEVIYQSKDREHNLNVMEPFFISENQSFGRRGYNMTLGGEGTFGYKRPDLVEWNKKQKGVKKNPYLKTINSTSIPCQHCEVITTIGNHKRWHGDNCRFKVS